MNCGICNGTDGTSVMTDGRDHTTLCRRCRDLVVMFFHVYGSLKTAVNETRQSLGFPRDDEGSTNVPV
jgi:hypothetical protein